MAQRTETEILADIKTVETAINEIVSSGLVGVSVSGGGGISITSGALTALLDRKKELREELNALVSGSGSIVTLDYDIDEYGRDNSEYIDE
jgi:hypothetical protein